MCDGAYFTLFHAMAAHAKCKRLIFEVNETL